jgi:hypothetical protein
VCLPRVRARRGKRFQKGKKVPGTGFLQIKECDVHTKGFVLVIAIILAASLSCDQQAGLKPGDKMFPVTKLSLPGKDWFVEVSTEGFTVQKSGEKPGGQGIMFLAFNEASGVVMSAYLLKAPKAGNSKDAREYYWGDLKNGPLKQEEVKITDLGEMPLIEYMVKEAQGKQIDQKHYRGFLAKDDAWFDIHLSKVQYKPEEDRLFTSILKSVKINTGVTTP